jgi:ABC-type transporter Mla subunit MlaD
MPGLSATPATMSARQLQAVVDDIAARRSQVQALVTQLNTFDEQLAALETSLTPLLQWLRTWSELEGAVTDFWAPRPPRS